MNKITIITGLIRTGKTTTLKDWVDKNPSVCGVLTPDVDNERTFVHYPDRTQYQMVCDKSVPDAIKIGKYHFHAESFERINDLLIEDFNSGKCNWLVIDELGRLELKEKGLHRAAKYIFEHLQDSEKRIVLIIRKKLVDELVLHYKLEDYRLIPKEKIKEMFY